MPWCGLRLDEFVLVKYSAILVDGTWRTQTVVNYYYCRLLLRVTGMDGLCHFFISTSVASGASPVCPKCLIP